MATVESLLRKKGHDIWSISPDDSVFEAIRLMDEKGIGALAVVHDGALVGIISERDYARKVILKGRSSRDTPVRDIMTRKVFHTLADESVENCMLTMTKNHIRHLPVMDSDRLIGMISMGDVVKHIIEAQQDQIKHLEHCMIWEESY
ncbi:MAG TPA: CBS domain-containing protein [Gammaproteobacteria bacterium]|nr:CBS domain-containing protein [Gammaproteobacteria bacterium]